tara:strand:- start:5755 stop:6552 length:798 start_codon:yes stop_codon:yes gene_type:complete
MIKKEVLIGDCRLILGDCLEVMPTLDKIDAVVTDPPYGTTACKWDSIIPLDTMWGELNKITNDKCPIVLFSSQPFTTKLISSNYEMFKYCWVWDKVKPSTGLHCKIMPLRKTEDIVIFGTNSINYYPQMVRCEARIDKSRVASNGETFGGKNVLRQHSNDGLEYPKNIITYTNANQSNRVHPTQKPENLMKYIINTYTKEKDIVLDFTMGSGTTGVACAKLGRKFIGIELDPDYFEIACERIRKAYEQPDLFIAPPQRTIQEQLL